MKENINILIKNFRYKSWLEKIVSRLEILEKLEVNQISVLITGDHLTKKLNKKYRKINKTTDVLSFAERDIKNNFFYNIENYLGEIIINIEQVKRQSKDFKKEILLLFIHGYLHLRGYDHKTVKQGELMNKKINELMEKV